MVVNFLEKRQKIDIILREYDRWLCALDYVKKINFSKIEWGHCLKNKNILYICISVHVYIGIKKGVWKYTTSKGIGTEFFHFSFYIYYVI